MKIELPDECPACQHGFMIQRKGRYGSFMGCSEYPRCKHTESISGADSDWGDGFGYSNERRFDFNRFY